MTYIEIKTEEEWKKEVMENEKAVIVDFWAPWCGPCKAFALDFKKVSDDSKMEGIKFVKVNVDDNGELASKYEVRGIPAILIFKKVEKIAEIAGALSEYSLINFINENK